VESREEGEKGREDEELQLAAMVEAMLPVAETVSAQVAGERGRHWSREERGRH